MFIFNIYMYVCQQCNVCVWGRGEALTWGPRFSLCCPLPQCTSIFPPHGNQHWSHFSGFRHNLPQGWGCRNSSHTYGCADTLLKNVKLVNIAKVSRKPKGSVNVKLSQVQVRIMAISKITNWYCNIMSLNIMVQDGSLYFAILNLLKTSCLMTFFNLIQKALFKFRCFLKILFKREIR